MFVLKFLYSILIHIVSFFIKLIALFNTKLRLGVIGRKETFKKLDQAITPTDKTVWFHCASLGEYEQGLPVFKAFKEKHPRHKVILSFFSPSGYEIKKESAIADIVVYMPLDTSANAKRFLNIANPELTVFVKYEIWPNFLSELKKREHHVVLISALFRKQQAFFKWYGGLMRKSLNAFNHIFTQNEVSRDLLKSINYNKATVSGDTRFDRVFDQLSIDNTIDFIEKFKDSKLVVIFGSSWPEDDKLFIPFINSCKNPDVKFIIAPHKISDDYSQSLKNQIQKPTILYSEIGSENLIDYDVFILNTIGYLSKAYGYADIAYIGGAAGTTGLHNILEPATFSIPIVIGKNYSKFPEAEILINLNGVVSVTNKKELCQTLKELIQNTKLRKEKGEINANFIETNKGSTNIILSHLSQFS